MVLLGIDRINEPDTAALLSGGRLGVISAASGLASCMRFPIDILNEKFRVSAIFSPEHGPRGVAGPGERVPGGVDRATGLPVFSLFEDFISLDDSQAPISGSALSGIDRFVFEMQDVGSRYFTYVSTLFCVMRECGKRGVPLTVLDRPNPIGGVVEGCLPDQKNLSFIGMTEVPIRHGMTVGELARFYNGEYGLGCDLSVIELRGWRRDTYYDETGLPFVRPSPNLPTFESILLYNGTCMLAGTNVSEGRGTTLPFSMIGAEFIDPDALCRELSRCDLYGVAFSPAYFRPDFSKSAGKVLYGVQIHVTDKRALQPVRLGVTLIRTLQRMYPDDFSFNEPAPGGRYHIDLSTGNSDLRLSSDGADAIMQRWNTDAGAFAARTEKYRLYE
ncbi:MAG: DUF1343 domain-containing protein [Clostridia bacterium]|nr:DUF1343 domain-containing protein [Clostridia bacterium]